MLTVEYTPKNSEALNICDANIEFEVNKIITDYYRAKEKQSTYTWEIQVCNENIITYFRVAIKEKKLLHTDVIFKSGEVHITSNIAGRLSQWPEELQGYVINWLSRL